MKFKIKNEIIILILIILMNLAIRYPVIPHEIGSDSYYIHYLSNTITTSGEVIFISHPLQFLGFSSQPPGVPIFISGLSQCTGLSTESAILLLSLIVTILCVFTIYTLIYKVTKNKFQSQLATLTFSTAPEILRLTLWTATTRALFMAMFPLLLYFLLKSLDKKERLRSIFLFILSATVLLSLHHLGILILFVLFVFIVTIILTENSFEITMNNKKIPDCIIWVSVFTFLISLIIFRVGFIKDNMNLWATYTHGFIYNDDSSSKAILVNILFDYLGKIGVLIFLAPIGILALFNLKKKRNIFENFTLTSLIFSAPIIGVGVYTPMFLSIYIIFLISVGAMVLLKNSKMKKELTILLSLGIVVSLCFSSFMLFHWGYKTMKYDVDKYMPESKNTAMFLKKYGGNGSFTSNERGGNLYKYSAYSGMMAAPGEKYEKKSGLRPKLNFDVGTLLGGGVESLITFESENRNINTTDKNTTDKNITLSWYEAPKLWAGNINEGTYIINKYDIQYVLETQFGYEYSLYYAQNMNFFVDTHKSRPLIFDNAKEKIYLLK